MLQKQNISLNIAEGLDTKTDSKHVLPGKLTTLQNGVYRKNKRIDKRYGFDSIPNVDVSGTSLGTGSGLATFNDELLQYNNQKVYSYSSGANAWVDKGSAVSAIVTSNQIIRNTASQSQCDSAITGGVGVYAWEDSRGGVRASVVDETTGTPMLSDVSLDASGSRVRCLAFNKFLFVFYYKSGALYVRRVNPLKPTSFDAAVTVSSTVNTTTPHYDVYAYQNLRILFAHSVQGASEIKVGWLSDAPAVLSGIFGAVTVSSAAATNCLGLVPGPNSTFYLAFHNTSNGLECAILNNGGDVVHEPFVVEAVTASNIVNVTGYELSSGDGVQLLYEQDAASTYNQLVRQCQVNSDGSAETASDFLRSVGLWSKAFTYTDSDGNENSFVGVAHESTLQATYFIARSDGMIVGKQQYTNGGGLTSRAILANINSESSAVFSYAILKKSQIVSENATIFTPTGVMKTSIDFTSDDIFKSKQLGNNLLIAGGVLSMYDGQSVVEHGFHLYPENVSTSTSTSGGSVADGTYNIIVLYEWTDAFGQIHRSQPSVAIEEETSGGGTSTITVTVPTLRLTAKDGSTRSNVSLVGYATTPGGSTYYRFTSITSPTYNDTTADTVDLTISDAISESNEILYTTGGVLPNYPSPACSVIEVFQNRIWLGGLEDTNKIMYSKEHKDGEPVEFSSDFTKAIEPAGGRVSAFGVLDDKILIFKRDRFFYTYGDGPNNTNTLGAYSELQAATVDAGTQNSRSITRLPNGLIYKSAKGFYAVDGTLNPVYIGADIEGFNSLTVTSATLLSDVNEIRFTTSDGDLLCYNYYFNRWSTFTGLKSTSGLLWGTSFVLLKTNGKIFKESTNYKDDKRAFGMTLVTGWIALNGVTGLKRVYRMLMLGEYKSPHKLRISVGYDYSPAWIHSQVYDPDTSMPITRYGDDSPYGETNTLYGGESNAYVLTCYPAQQKCGAIRFKIEELVTSATSGTQESLTISDIGLLVGIKQGQIKTKSANTIGLS